MTAELPALPSPATAEGRRRHAVRRQLRLLIRQRQHTLQLLHLFSRQAAAGSPEHRAYQALIAKLQAVEVWQH